MAAAVTMMAGSRRASVRSTAHSRPHMRAAAVTAAAMPLPSSARPGRPAAGKRRAPAADGPGEADDADRARDPHTAARRAPPQPGVGGATPPASAAEQPCCDEHVATVHGFSCGAEIVAVRERLLGWFAANRRALPWRRADGVVAADGVAADQRAYEVLVSEMMLQQTQVATVRAFYERWMARWPTAAALADATPEQVRELWAGLGYYARGMRLHQAARTVTRELGGRFPRTAAELQAQLPGVGRYTAGAVASIAFGQPVPAVDGNVIRVVARLRAIGAEIGPTGPACDLVWTAAEQLVGARPPAEPVARPGNLTEALMELGATICTPRAPACNACPVSAHCRALALDQPQPDRRTPYERDRAAGVRSGNDLPPQDARRMDACGYCLPSDARADTPGGEGVTRFPRRPRRQAPRAESYAVCVLHDVQRHRFLLTRRHDRGLLAGFWEFPNVPLAPPASEEPADAPYRQLADRVARVAISAAGPPDGAHSSTVASVATAIQARLAACGVDAAPVVQHQFTHVRHTYRVFVVAAPPAAAERSSGSDACCEADAQWAGSADILGRIAVSTAMRKVFRTAAEALGQVRITSVWARVPKY